MREHNNAVASSFEEVTALLLESVGLALVFDRQPAASELGVEGLDDELVGLVDDDEVVTTNGGHGNVFLSD